MRHDGELAVQRRTGILKPIGSARIGATIPRGFDDFLSDQPFVILGAGTEAVWATVLTGDPGFARIVDERTVVIDAVPGPEDPLFGHLNAEQEVGLLAIEPETRRRIRLNGKARSTGDGLVLRTDQAYGNCPKYIQQRVITASHDASGAGRRTYDGTALTTTQRDRIAGADTFFIASAAAGLGVDASHRGGPPGFVRVLDERRLAWPDYVGNSMFMTLGNLELNPAAGLLFVDWDRGDTLHLTGRATVDWDPARAATMPGAQRVVDFEVDRVVQLDGASPLRWRLVSASP